MILGELCNFAGMLHLSPIDPIFLTSTRYAFVEAIVFLSIPNSNHEA